MQDTLPERASELTVRQRAFLHQLAARLPDIPQDDNALQAALFDTARLTPIAPAHAFQAIYRTLLDRDSGPKAGNLLAFLDRDFVVQRLLEVPYDKSSDEPTFWQETSISRDEFDAWRAEHREHIKQITTTKPKLAFQAKIIGFVECTVELDDNRTHMRRVQLGEFTDQAALDVAAQAYVESVTGE